MNWMALQLTTTALLIFMSGIFSATEVSYTGLSLGQIKRINRLRPGILSLWEKNPDRILAVLILSNNAVNIGIGVLAASMAHEWRSVVGTSGSLFTALFGIL